MKRHQQPEPLRFLSGWRRTLFRLGFMLRMIRYLVRRRQYPLFRLGIRGDGMIKTFRLMRRIGLKRMVRLGDRTYFLPTTVHYPSRAFDRAVARGAFNVASAGTAQRRQLGTALLAISADCPLRCSHCYARHSLEVEQEEITILQWQRIIRALQQMGTSVIILTGGEPMLRLAGVLELLREADRDLSDFHLHTSGYGVTRENARLLRAAGLEAAAVGLDDVDEERHDALRGQRGAFRRALQALEHFRAAGVLTYVNLCATRELIRSGDLWNYYELARSLQVGFIQLLEPRPVGGFLHNGREVLLTEEDRSMLTEFVLRASGERAFRDYPVIYYLARAESPEHAGCTMGGLMQLYIDAGGHVNPCVFMPVSFGNIKAEPFEAIHTRMRAAIPRPLHCPCPSLLLGGLIDGKRNAGLAIPISYSAIEQEWKERLYADQD